MDRLEKLFEAVDQISDMDVLSELELRTKDSSYTRLFWEQRKLALTGESEVIRKRARIKCRMITQHYNAAIPVKKGIQRFATPHGFAGIHISVFATVGKGCTIFQHVVIGSNTLIDSKTQGAPVIGDNVFIGAGAMIIGNVHVGNNARIGANAIVTSDVPENTVVVASGIRMVQKDYPLNNKFLTAAAYKKLMQEQKMQKSEEKG